MSSQKEIYKDGEINIYELISILWKNKLIILFSTIIFAAIMLGYLISKKPVIPVYKAETKINSISLFDSKEYKNFNEFISFYAPISASSILKFDKKTLTFNNLKLNYFDNIRYKKINESFLLDLFLEKLRNDVFLAKILKKSKILNKEDFKNTEDYEKEILKLANTIKIREINDGKNYIFEAKIKDKKKWENFLNILEKNTNIEVQSYIKENFSNYMQNQILLKKYRIEDLQIKLEGENEDNAYIYWLKNEIKKLSNNKQLERFKDSFNLTPVVKSNQFSAGKINIQGTKYKRTNKAKSKKSMILLAGLIGAILSILYVIITNNIRKSRDNL